MASHVTTTVGAANMTREMLSRRSGIAEGRISELLNGKRAWYLEDVERIAAALELDPLRLLDAALNISQSAAVVNLKDRRQTVTPRPEDLGAVAEDRDGTDEGDYEGA